MVAQGQKPAAWVLFAGGRLSKEATAAVTPCGEGRLSLLRWLLTVEGKRAGGLWWLRVLHGQPLEAAAGGTQGGKGEEKERREEKRGGVTA